MMLHSDLSNGTILNILTVLIPLNSSTLEAAEVDSGAVENNKIRFDGQKRFAVINDEMDLDKQHPIGCTGDITLKYQTEFRVSGMNQCAQDVDKCGLIKANLSQMLTTTVASQFGGARVV